MAQEKGHFNKVCCECKANEKFSNKRHTQHIYKQCISSLKHGMVTDEVEIRLDKDFTDCIYNILMKGSL